MNRLKIITLAVLTMASSVLLHASENKQALVYRFEMKEEVTPGLARKFSKALAVATEKKATLFLIHMNTYGGMLDAADSIRTAILNSNIPVAVFIDNNAASAGALISIACNRIYMRSGSSIGAATVVNEKAEAMPDKYQSYMRSMMRATAEKRGRNPKIAEAMVDPRTYIEGVNDSGRVLTFTATEAVKNNFCNGIAESIDDVLKAENISGSKMETYIPTATDKIIGFLINPAISGLLILVMLGGLYFEFQAPGTIFPIAAALVAAMLYFAPLYIEGLAANWEILLFIVGLALIAVELFFIPGFGVIGVAGIICVATGFILSMVNNIGFDFTYAPEGQLTKAAASAISGMVLSLFAIIFFGGKIVKSSRFNKMVLNTSMNSGEGYKVNYSEGSLIGQTGSALTDLRPSGKIVLNQKIVNASAISGYIERGAMVEVVDEGFILTVKKI